MGAAALTRDCCNLEIWRARASRDSVPWGTRNIKAIDNAPCCRMRCWGGISKFAVLIQNMPRRITASDFSMLGFVRVADTVVQISKRLINVQGLLMSL